MQSATQFVEIFSSEGLHASDQPITRAGLSAIAIDGVSGLQVPGMMVALPVGSYPAANPEITGIEAARQALVNLNAKPYTQDEYRLSLVLVSVE